jgi:hypothetical protein
MEAAMGRFGNSLALAKASWAVLRADKELIVFPIVSAIAAALVALLFALPLWASGFFDRIGDGDSPKVFSYAVLFVFYLVLYTVINFCNAALVGAAMIRLRGGDPTAADGFRLAANRMGPIVGYALIGATVGIVLQIIRDKTDALGDIFAGLLDAAWGVVTYLAIPVLVVEEVGPIEAVKRSASLLKRTWGEQLIGNAGIGLVVGLAALAAGLAAVALVALAATIGGVILAVLVGVVAGVGVAAVIAVGAALRGIYTAALYRYAADGTSGGFFRDDLIQNAFIQKHGRRWGGI